MDLKRFIKEIELDEEGYMSVAYVLKSKGENMVVGIKGAANVAEYTEMTNELLSEDVKGFYLGIDFHKNNLIPTDYIGIVYFDEKEKWGGCLLPYANGQKMEAIGDHELLGNLIKQFERECPLN